MAQHRHGKCWGTALRNGDASQCDPTFVTGRGHFKNKFCPNCRMRGINVEASRLRATDLNDGSIKNELKYGFWSRTADGCEYRLVNQTVGCPGAPVLIFPSDRVRPSDAWKVACLRPLDPKLVDERGCVRLMVSKGTLVPRAWALEVITEATKRSLDALMAEGDTSASAGGPAPKAPSPPAPDASRGDGEEAMALKDVTHTGLATAAWREGETMSSLKALGRLLEGHGVADRSPTVTDEASSHASSGDAVVGLAAGVNKKVRQLLLRQNRYTNRFEGSTLAEHAERAYARHVTYTKRPRLARRIIFFAVLLPAISLAHAPRKADSPRVVTMLLLSLVAPVLVLLVALRVTCMRSASRHWRTHVVCALLLADSCNIWSDALMRFDHFTPRDKDFHLMWELSRYLVMLCACSMASLSGLSLMHTFVLFIAHYLMYASAAITLYVVWWHSSDQGPWTWRFHDTALENRFGGLNELNRTCTWLSDHMEGHQRHQGGEHSTVLIDCLILAALASATNMWTLHRLNRSDREGFVGSFALRMMVKEQTQLLRGERVEVLALFSNPSLQHLPSSVSKEINQPSGPLALGRELKSLLRAVPSPYVYIEPAATIEDVAAAVRRHNPQLAIFSGHSMSGSLLLERPDGAVDLPTSDDFLAALEPEEGVGSKLRCLVLNGCDTIGLAEAIIPRFPKLRVVCWKGLADDAAARAFMSGFYGAVGTDLLADVSLEIEAAFEAGLDAFHEAGFTRGDPTPYLHRGLDHAHVLAPRFGECEACSPPVHGCPSLVSFEGGAVRVVGGLEEPYPGGESVV